MLTTASDLLFTGTDGGCRSRADPATAVACQLGRGQQGPVDPALLAAGTFHAFDARTGQMLWSTAVGGAVHAGPMTYAVDGTQFVTIAAGRTLFAFALRR